jgi:hypothetical protein
MTELSKADESAEIEISAELTVLLRRIAKTGETKYQ